METLKRIWRWIDHRISAQTLIKPATHPVPRGSGWWYVFGSATLVAFVLQILSGMALVTIFPTSTAHAYQALEFLTREVWLHRFVRSLHYFGGSAMVLFIGVHMTRVFLMGAYKYPRELNWLSGVLLLMFTVVDAFTGQLLRWDQNAIWTTVVTAEQAGRVPWVGPYLARLVMGGDVLNAETLTRFFTLHAFVLPALIIAVLGLHLYLVVNIGISEPPKPGVPVDRKTYRARYEEILRSDGVPFWPDAAWRDVVFGGALVAGIVILAVFMGPPALSGPPDPTVIQAEPRPDWYFLWYFSILALLPHLSENYFMFMAPAFAFLLLFSLPFLFNQGERSARNRPWAVGSVILILILVGTMWIMAYSSPWSPNFDARPLSVTVIGASSGPVYDGGVLFYEKGCIYCHMIEGEGGRRGPDLSYIADRITADRMRIRIMNGGYNMPAFAGNMTADQLSDLVAFLETRRVPGTQPVK